MDPRLIASIIGIGSMMIPPTRTTDGSASKPIPLSETSYQLMLDQLVKRHLPMVKRFLAGKASFLQMVDSAAVYREDTLPLNIKSIPVFIVPKQEAIKTTQTTVARQVSAFIDQAPRIAYALRKLVGDSINDFDFQIKNVRNGKVPRSFSEQVKAWGKKLSAFKAIDEYDERYTFKLIVANSLVKILEGQITKNTRASFAHGLLDEPNADMLFISLYAPSTWYSNRGKGLVRLDKKHSSSLRHEVRHFLDWSLKETFDVRHDVARKLTKKIQNILNHSIPQLESSVMKQQFGLSKKERLGMRLFNIISRSELDDSVINDINLEDRDSLMPIIHRLIFRSDPLLRLENKPYGEYWKRYLFDSDKMKLMMERKVSHQQVFPVIAPSGILTNNDDLRLIYENKDYFWSILRKAMKIREHRQNLLRLRMRLDKEATHRMEFDTDHLNYFEIPTEHQATLGQVGDDMYNQYVDRDAKGNLSMSGNSKEYFVYLYCMLKPNMEPLEFWDMVGQKSSRRYRQFRASEGDFFFDYDYDIQYTQYINEISRVFYKIIADFDILNQSCMELLQDNQYKLEHEKNVGGDR